MNPATAHTFVRCANKIYQVDANGTGRELHRFETEQRARRWQRDQNKKRPGSATVGVPPKVAKIETDRVQQELNRKREISKLIIQQAAERARDKMSLRHSSSTSGPRPYVSPEQGASSFLRARSKKQVTSRNARNTRATYGGS